MAHDVLLTAWSKQAASQVILAVITRFFFPPTCYLFSFTPLWVQKSGKISTFAKL